MNMYVYNSIGTASRAIVGSIYGASSISTMIHIVEHLQLEPHVRVYSRIAYIGVHANIHDGIL
jgi:hypothetical protein